MFLSDDVPHVPKAAVALNVLCPPRIQTAHLAHGEVVSGKFSTRE